MKNIGKLAVILAFAFLGMALNIVCWTVARGYADDNTTAGAYAAAAMLTFLPAAIIGAGVGGFVVYKIGD